MFLLLRVDHRLIHGQVAFTWVNNLNSDCILVANDLVSSDELKKTSIKLAKPQGVKLVIKNIDDSIAALNSDVTDKYKLMIIVESVEDAYKIVKNVPYIKSINLGGTKTREGTRNISKAVNLLPQEEDLLKDLINNDSVEVEIRQVPTDSKVLYKG
ncbi:PTS sugar transporter subunit IIB [Brachyspira pilosicoli]|uniref:PTS sugar transporter subunit IIB n=1 Tax=Brachyspira pilosicoli TaxID=52584 RepID=UPI003006F7E6